MPRKSNKQVAATVEPTTSTIIEEPIALKDAVGGAAPKPTKKRTFKIKLTENEFCSRITGHTPKQAASKALTLLVNMNKKNGNGKTNRGKIVFTIRETTRGSKGKEYMYQGEKIKLKVPTTYKIRSPSGEVKEIINRYRNVIEKHQEKTT